MTSGELYIMHKLHFSDIFLSLRLVSICNCTTMLVNSSALLVLHFTEERKTHSRMT